MIYSDYLFCNHVVSVIVHSNANSSGELQRIVTGFTSIYIIRQHQHQYKKNTNTIDNSSTTNMNTINNKNTNINTNIDINTNTRIIVLYNYFEVLVKGSKPNKLLLFKKCEHWSIRESNYLKLLLYSTIILKYWGREANPTSYCCRKNWTHSK